MRVKGVAAGLLSSLAALALPAAAGAATITPNAFGDDFAANGTCSLREAVSLANADLTSFQGCTVSADEDADTIQLAPGQTYTLALPGVENANASGDLDILNEPLTIESAGPSRATIFANGAVTGDRAIDVDDQVSPTGGVTANLTDVDISGGDDTAGAGGGAIRHNFGLLNVTRSRISGNNSTGGGGAVLRLDGSASLIETVITGNTGGGGAIFQEFGNLSLVRSAITGHAAESVFDGGGAILKQSLTSGTLTIHNSTISGNSAKAGGGGLWVLGGGITTILNSTIAGNTADADGGDRKRATAAASWSPAGRSTSPARSSPTTPTARRRATSIRTAPEP